MMMGKLLAEVGSLLATVTFGWALFQQYFPSQFRDRIQNYVDRVIAYFRPYIEISFPEYSGDRLRRSEVFSDIQNYLSSKSLIGAKRLKAEAVKNSKSLILSIDDYEEVMDEYEGVKIWWTSRKSIPNHNHMSFSYYPNNDEKRYYKLTCHRRHRNLVTGRYINHIMEEGKAVQRRNRQRKLYMNKFDSGWRGNSWRHVPFEHPSSFRTLAMDPKKKQEIIDDLVKFKKGKEYYGKVGKPWKRGYLLYGPPGTGKSTMIAAMADFMEYDVYDLELTSVKDNSDLKNLLIETSSKSITVIEDIDCSLDLTGQRKKNNDEHENNPVKKAEEDKEKESKVTLSGLLNFIDGIWSACGGERLIIFTTNHVDKLDPALIRRGRMDKHIEMSYCKFEAFKVLAVNYLDVEWHDSFEEIRRLLEEKDMTPADVAENLMPKSEGEEADECFKRLIEALVSEKGASVEKKEKEAKEIKEDGTKDSPKENTKNKE